MNAEKQSNYRTFAILNCLTVLLAAAIQLDGFTEVTTGLVLLLCCYLAAVVFVLVKHFKPQLQTAPKSGGPFRPDAKHQAKGASAIKAHSERTLAA